MAIIKISQDPNLSFRFPEKKGRATVLAGGCFDILHVGHVKFFQTARKYGDFLILLLESDRKVRMLKGKNRPLFSQKERARVLEALGCVDYILLLPYLFKDSGYEKIATKLSPNIIAFTKGDPLSEKKKQLAKKVGAKPITIPFYQTLSSSKLAKILGVD